MKRFLLNIILFFVLQSNTYSQQWDWAYGLYGNAVNTYVDIVSDTITGHIYTTGNFHDTLTFNGTVIVNPLSNTGTNINSSVFINKINADGQILWTKIVYGPNVKASAVTVHQGKIYATGNYQDTLFFGNDTLTTASCGGAIGLDESIYLICFDTSGTLLYLTDFGCSAGYYPDDILVNDSGVYISGIFSEYIFMPNDTIVPFALPSVFLTRAGLNGNRLSTTIGAHPSAIRYFQKTLLTDDDSNNIYLAGHYDMVFNYQNSSVSGANTYIAKLKANGDLISLNNFCQSDSIVLTDVKKQQNVFYFSGSMFAPSRFGADSFYIPLTGSVPESKAFYTILDTSLNFIKTIATEELGTKGRALSVDNAKNIYWSVDFDTTLTLLSNQLFNIPSQTIPLNNAVLKITGTTIRYKHLISGDLFFVGTSTIDKLGNLYLAGLTMGNQYYDTAVFIINNISEDGFLARISCRAPAPTIFANDTIMCWNEKIELSSFAGAGGFYSLMWFNGNDSNSVNVDSSGTYWVIKVDENGCISDTGFISIYQYPKTNITITRICDSLWVAYPAAGEWWFNDNIIQTGNSIYTSQDGWYVYHNIDSNGCSIIDSIYRSKQVYNVPISAVCDSLAAIGINGLAVWYLNSNPVDTSQYLIIHESGTYYYAYTDSIGCLWQSDSIHINVSRLAPPVTYYPNPVYNKQLIITGVFSGTIQIIAIDGTIEKQWFFDDATSSATNSRCGKNNHQKIILQLGDISPGIHFLRISGNANNYFSGKLIISE